jgi:hypothetical protein
VLVRAKAIPPIPMLVAYMHTIIPTDSINPPLAMSITSKQLNDSLANPPVTEKTVRHSRPIMPRERLKYKP